MVEKPNYADKITFQGSYALAQAMDYLYRGVYDKFFWTNYRNNHPISIIKLSDAYKFNLSLIGCKKYIREVGERINDILEIAEIDYDRAEFYPRSNLYTYPSACNGRPHMHIYSKQGMFLLECLNENEIVIRSMENEEIHYKIEGTNYFDKFRVIKITEVNEDIISKDTRYKSLKNEDSKVYVLSTNEDKLKIIVNNDEIENDKELESTIKRVNLSNFNLEKIFNLICKNISLQKSENSYLNVKKSNANQVTDEILIKKGIIYVTKSLNANTKYEVYGDLRGRIHQYNYFGKGMVSYKAHGENYTDFVLKADSIGLQKDSFEKCKKINDDVNTQYKKVLSYMK